jgi:dTDP-4-dehydrorhamnose reductase
VNTGPIAIVGANGQLGRDLVGAAERRGIEVAALTHDDLEIADPAAVGRVLSELQPSAVINTAACQGAQTYAAPDQQAYFRGNALGPWNLARWCAGHASLLVHYSTDYVFGGEYSDRPFTEEDLPWPVNIYGASKLAGEHLVRAVCPRHYVVRVASLYGRNGSRAKAGSNFVKMVLGQARRGQALSIVDDQTMSPTSTRAVAEKTTELLLGEAPFGLYHMAGSGACTWYEMAREITRIAGLVAKVQPSTTESETPGAPFLRPRYTALDNAALRRVGLGDLPDWRDCLREYVSEEMTTSQTETEYV